MKAESDDLRALRSIATPFGIERRFVVSEESPSTNRDAVEWLEQNPESPHGAVFVTARQTAGRGTRGRSWWAPTDAALPMSIVIAPAKPMPRPTAVTLVAALAACDVARGLGAVSHIKWPNDLVDSQGAKMCGILAEMVRLDPVRLVVGIGVNCRDSREDPPPDLRIPHSNLERAGARATSRVEIAIEICRAFDSRLDEFLDLGFPPLARAFNERSWLRGRRVELGFGSRIVRGIFDSIDDEFRVVGRDDSGLDFALPCEQLELRRYD